MADSSQGEASAKHLTEQPATKRRRFLAKASPSEAHTGKEGGVVREGTSLPVPAGAEGHAEPAATTCAQSAFAGAGGTTDSQEAATEPPPATSQVPGAQGAEAADHTAEAAAPAALGVGASSPRQLKKSSPKLVQKPPAQEQTETTGEETQEKKKKDKEGKKDKKDKKAKKDKKEKKRKAERAPEEEAERQRRKQQKKEKKEILARVKLSVESILKSRAKLTKKAKAPAATRPSGSQQGQAKAKASPNFRQQ